MAGTLIWSWASSVGAGVSSVSESGPSSHWRGLTNRSPAVSGGFSVVSAESSVSEVDGESPEVGESYVSAVRVFGERSDLREVGLIIKVSPLIRLFAQSRRSVVVWMRFGLLPTGCSVVVVDPSIALMAPCIVPSKSGRISGSASCVMCVHLVVISG